MNDKYTGLAASMTHTAGPQDNPTMKAAPEGGNMAATLGQILETVTDIRSKLDALLQTETQETQEMPGGAGGV